MRRFIVMTALAAMLASGNALAQAQQTPEQLLEDGAKRIVEAMRLLLMAIPQYEAPVVLENGDILIRRVQPEDRRPSAGPTGPTESET
jgi:hypothetical protein